jgi:hypothetical protein
LRRSSSMKARESCGRTVGLRPAEADMAATVAKDLRRAK